MSLAIVTVALGLWQQVHLKGSSSGKDRSISNRALKLCNEMLSPTNAT